MRRRSPKLASIGEFGWLEKLLPKLHWPKSRFPQLWIGPGDDAGVMGITPGKVLVATTDGMIEGIHFKASWNRWNEVGYKILAVNLSDLAAMGDVRPLAALVTAAFPGDTSVDSVDKFTRGLNRCAQRWKTGLLGGDTIGSRHGWFLSVALFGEADPRHLVRRSGARAGDFLLCSGPLGLAAAGLEVLESGAEKLSWTRPLLRAFFEPQPRLAWGALLGRRRWATSLLDCSDGLSASVRLLSKASRVGFTVDLAKLPPHAALARWATRRGKPAHTYALEGGEDYELIFTCRPKTWPALRRAIPSAAIIGQALPQKTGCWATDGRKRHPLESDGFPHFRKK
jgi:thiamine-monophosphate kinase